MSLFYCGQLVRKHEPDHFLISVFLPPDMRKAIWALYAFNYEIKRTRGLVTETQLGLIRLQWWRDSIRNIYQDKEISKAAPVVESLAHVIKKYDLPLEKFESLIYAREFDLEDRVPDNLEGTVKYADFTTTPLLQLCCRVLEIEEDVKNAAVAWGLVSMLLKTREHLQTQQCYLPADMLPPIEQLYQGESLEDLKPAVQAIVQKAEDLLQAETEEKFLRSYKKLTKIYLQHIRKAEYDLFSWRMRLPPLLKEIKMWWV